MADDREAVLKAIDSAFEAVVTDLFKVFVLGILDDNADHKPAVRFEKALGRARDARSHAIASLDE